MARKLFGAGVAGIIVAGIAVILAAQGRAVRPEMPSSWIRLNDNVAIELKPCPDPRKTGDPYAVLRGDLCGSLMLRAAPDSGWHRVLLDSSPPPIGGIQPIVK